MDYVSLILRSVSGVQDEQHLIVGDSIHYT